jgi:lipid II:glycine glycyltransferase (peptidoglycan interpeptide bridge formation enzyme)
MMADIREVESLPEWREWVEKLNLPTFLHSPEWVEMNRRDGHQVWQLGLYENGNLTEICLVIKISARRGTFLFTPHGPQSETLKSDNLKLWRDYLIKLCRREKAVFWRVSPIVASTKANARLFTNLGFRSAPIHMHKELTSVLDLTQTEEQLLAAMRKTTRQMIRKGLQLIPAGEVVVEYPSQISEEMLSVYRSTSKRGHFVPFSDQFLSQEWDCFKTTNQGKLISISHQGRILSWGMVVFCGRRAFYHQGANILSKTIPAAYLTHFMGIRASQAENMLSYDFWGVGPANQPDHPWASISLFKRGFGGADEELLHAQDYVVNHLVYWPIWAVDAVRALKRGFGLPFKLSRRQGLDGQT